MSSVLSSHSSHGPHRTPMLRRALRAGTLAATLSVFLLVTIFGNVAPASAYWKSAGTASTRAATGTLLAPASVTVPIASSGDVDVSWTPSAGSPTPSGYFVTRTTGGVTTAACGSSRTVLLTTASCTDVSVPDGTYTYTVTAGFRSWTASRISSGSVTVTSPVATKLVFLTPAVSGQASDVANLGPITVELQDDSGVPMAAPSGGAVVTLTSSSLGTKIFSAALGGPAVTSVTIPAGSFAATFYYGDRTAGTPTITARTGLLSASQTATVTAAAGSTLAFISAQANGAATNPSRATVGPITLQFQDRFGNAVIATSDIVINLSSDSKNVPVFAATYAGTATTTVTILANSSSVAFFHGDTKAGAPEITAATISGTLIAKQKVSFSAPNSANFVTTTTTSTTSTARSAPAPSPTEAPVAALVPTVEPTPTPAPAPAPAPALGTEPTPATEPTPVLSPIEPQAAPPVTEPVVANEPLVAIDPSPESTGS
ncbi:hypothetical protein ABIE24_000776 [Mycetocola sp. 2940]